MAFITLFEVIDIVIMTLALGFIFMKIFAPRPRENYDPMEEYTKKRSHAWRMFLVSAAIIAPGIILHEMAHKFLAMAFGLHATFFAACSIKGVFGSAALGDPSLLNFSCILLMATVALSYFNLPILIFVPGYVEHIGNVSPLGSALIAFAGPAFNGLLWLFCWLSLKKKLLPKKYTAILFLSSRINMFLFFFNLIPIPPFDGFQVALGLFQTFF